MFKAEDRDALQRLTEQDPYWKEGLVASHVIREWKPMFGMLGLSVKQMEDKLTLLPDL